jgi:2-keto-3-deoxy-L-rhamnonate aldolase RhmA
MSTARPDIREFRNRVKAGEPVLGTFMKFPVPQPTEILGQVGFDFVMLDEEHSPWTREQLGHAYLGARAFGIAPIVRISRPDAASVLSCLDDGAVGVMCPHVDNAQMARNLASWSRYKGGSRGSGVSRGGDYGGKATGGIDAYYEWADGVSTVFAMIEDAAAIENIEEASTSSSSAGAISACRSATFRARSRLWTRRSRRPPRPCCATARPSPPSARASLPTTRRR